MSNGFPATAAKNCSITGRPGPRSGSAHAPTARAPEDREGSRSRDGGRPQPGTARHPALIGESDVDRDLVGLCWKVRKQKLRAPEHGEQVSVDRSPREVDEPLAPLPVHRGTAKVSVDDTNLGDPLGRSRIGGNKADRLAPDLKSDVDVGVGSTGSPGQLVAADHQPHRPSVRDAGQPQGQAGRRGEQASPPDVEGVALRAGGVGRGRV